MTDAVRGSGHKVLADERASAALGLARLCLEPDVDDPGDGSGRREAVDDAMRRLIVKVAFRLTMLKYKKHRGSVRSSEGHK